MAKQDYCEVLGVDRDVDEAAVRRTYRNLAMKYHPEETQLLMQCSQPVNLMIVVKIHSPKYH